MGSFSLHSPLHHPLFSRPCSLEPPFLFSSPRNGLTRRKNRASVDCLERGSPKDESFCRRRPILYMGFAAIPFPNKNAEAVEGINAENSEPRTPNQKQQTEQSVEENPSGNPFLSVVNALGFLGPGMLAALYASLKKEKETSDAITESDQMINAKLKEKEAAITLLERKFESDLSNEKEYRNMALSKANNEKQSLLDQLELANGTIKSLGGDLQKQKKLAEDQNIRIEHLEIDLNRTRDENNELQEQLQENFDSLSLSQEKVNLLSLEIKDTEDNLQTVNSKIDQKERELDQLSSVYKQTQDRIAGLNLEIQKSKILLAKKEKELESKNTMVNNLKADLTRSRAEIDESSKTITSIMKEYDEFKMHAEKKASSYDELLGEKEKVVQVCLDDANRNNVLISDLEREKCSLAEMLDIESKNVKKLEMELEIVHVNLEKSRDEVSNLEKQFQELRKLYSELEAEVSKVKDEFREIQNSLQRDLDEKKRNTDILSEEIENMSRELTALHKERGLLQKELVGAHEKAENAARELKEEKNISSDLKKELKVLENRISEVTEAKKRLDVDLQASTKSLDETNRHALAFSNDLEIASSWISSLEDERDAILKALDEQKRVSREAHENLENARSLVMKLRNARENSEKRGNKLEEELASAKGEILRLKTRMKESESIVNDQMEQKVENGRKNGVSRGRELNMEKDAS
ncbi:MAR-binding filament-like protein [Orobanche gracilis]